MAAFGRFLTSRKNVSGKTFDYIIVGGGSAGSVLARRLSDEKRSVCLLEAGPSDFNWKIWMPAALMYNLCDDKYNWYYTTMMQKTMNNRKMYWPRGRVLGGSSSLNAMVYVRGHALDYDRWAKEGATGWDYKHCLPYFKRAESSDREPDDYRNNNGPLSVTEGKCDNPLYDTFIRAGKQAGYPFSKDMNGKQQEGFGTMDMTINKGWRSSSSAAYLNARNQSLHVNVNKQVDKVLFEGKKAVGVTFRDRISKGESTTVKAKEVILCGGAINTPQLLMLSGVGDKSHLNDVGIDCKHFLPGVGQNLQDHLEFYLQYRCKKDITLYDTQKMGVKMVKAGAKWFLTSKGPCATSHLEAGAFFRSAPGIDHPDVQLHFLPSLVEDHGRVLAEFHAYQAHATTLRATSKGWIRLKSKDPFEHPLIQPNYLTTEKDVVDFRNSVKLTREIFEQKAFDEFNAGEIQPGEKIKTDEEIDSFIRNRADSAYHPSCSCKMGKDDMSVVCPTNLKVHGLENIRIVDASIMPSIVSGNLNAPVIMMAEKAADIILGKPQLESKDIEVKVFSTKSQKPIVTKD